MSRNSLGSYRESDVVLLFKDISEQIEEQGNEERENIIQKGGHYSEMLPVEHEPSDAYIQLYHQSLKEMKSRLAKDIAVVAEKIFQRKKGRPVLVSFARAGTPIGILIKRYLEKKYKKEIPHFAISIIRGKGIDQNALQFILKSHQAEQIQFVDGWTGKGAILRQMEASLQAFERRSGILLDSELAVLADPAQCVSLYGTREDYLIPSACLNATVSGLISRTVLRDDLIGPEDFHGVKYYCNWSNKDLSNDFVEAISECFTKVSLAADYPVSEENPSYTGMKDVLGIKEHFQIKDINFIKPGVGETTRVLLRRVPWKILVKDKNNPYLRHILILAEEKGVPVEEYHNMSYACCGIIQSKGDI